MDALTNVSSTAMLITPHFTGMIESGGLSRCSSSVQPKAGRLSDDIELKNDTTISPDTEYQPLAQSEVDGTSNRVSNVDNQSNSDEDEFVDADTFVEEEKTINEQFVDFVSVPLLIYYRTYF